MDEPAGPTATLEPEALSRAGMRAVFQLLLRTAVMRGLTLGGMVVLARLLSPDDFGVYALVLAVVTIATYVGDLGLGAELVRQAHQPERHELATAWTAQQLLLVAGVGLIWLAAPVLLVVWPTLRPDAVWLLRVGSLALVLTGLRFVPQLLLIRGLRFGAIAAADVAMQIAFYAVAVAGALLGAGAWTFIFALLAQATTSTIVMNLAHRTWPGVALDVPTLRRLVRFGVPLQLSALVNWATDSALPLVGALAGGLTGIGHLQFASRLAILAASIDDIVTKVTFPVMGRLQDDPERRRRAAGRVLEMTTITIVAIEGLLVTLAPVLVPTIFSERWTPAVAPLQLMALAAFATVPARMLRALIWSSGRSAGTLALAVVAATISLGLAPLLVTLMGLVGAGLAAVAGGTASLILHRRAAAGMVEGSWSRVLTIYASGIGAIVTGSVMLRVAGDGPAAMVLATLAFITVGALGLLATSREQVRGAWATLRGRSTATAA